jgi:EmrB/QacA subfamily drug resistance transporter
MAEPVSGARPPAPADHRWLILVIVAIAQLMVVLDATVVNIALPSAQRALGFPNADRQWIVTAYALAFGGLLLLGGRIGDMFSRKRVFIIGLLGFAGSSALGGAATSFALLVTARSLQGAFGAILAPAALGTLITTFRDPRERGRAFGVFGSVAGAGGAVGLILGGFLTQDLSWRWTLYVNLIFAAIAVAGALVFIRGSKPASRPRIDVAGALLGGLGVFLIVFGFAHAETAGWSAALTVGSLLLGVLSIGAFALAEGRVRAPLLPLRVILDRTRAGAYLSVGVAAIALFGAFLFLTYYLQTIKGYSPVTADLAFLPMVGGLLVSANVSSNVLLPRIGPRILISSGLLTGAAAMAYLTQLSVTSSYAGGVPSWSSPCCPPGGCWPGGAAPRTLPRRRPRRTRRPPAPVRPGAPAPPPLPARQRVPGSSAGCAGTIPAQPGHPRLAIGGPAGGDRFGPAGPGWPAARGGMLRGCGSRWGPAVRYSARRCAPRTSSVTWWRPRPRDSGPPGPSTFPGASTRLACWPWRAPGPAGSTSAWGSCRPIRGTRSRWPSRPRRPRRSAGGG